MSSAEVSVREQIVASALWAAWGDALGFMTELADETAVARRTGVSTVRETRPWTRRVGGPFGAKVNFAAGTYSDDTQLRLATARAIAADGSFDIEAFSRVEIPILLAYGLGVGRGTKAAARSLAKPASSWDTNFFDDGKSAYLNGGGNGAAMRIQPHIWAAAHRERFDTWALPLLRNVVTTHGHPRGIGGAVFHGACLALAITENAVPDNKALRTILDWIGDLADLLTLDDELSELWLPAWERATGSELARAMADVAMEMEHLFHALEEVEIIDQSGWHEAVQLAGGFEPSTRGAGTITAILSAKLASAFAHDPERALIVGANALGSDTDTVCSMAGALLGAANPEFGLPSTVTDASFIARTASWLESVSRGTAVGRFIYPDLLDWSLPKSALDYVGTVNAEPVLAGLGSLRPVSEPVQGRRQSEVWQLFELNFGQTALIRTREHLRPLPTALAPRTRGPAAGKATVETAALRLFDDRPEPSSSGPTATPDQLDKESAEAAPRTARTARRVVSTNSVLPSPLSLDVAVDLVIGSGCPADLVGRVLLALAEQEGGTEKAIAFAGIVANAHRELPKQ